MKIHTHFKSVISLIKDVRDSNAEMIGFLKQQRLFILNFELFIIFVSFHVIYKKSYLN